MNCYEDPTAQPRKNLPPRRDLAGRQGRNGIKNALRSERQWAEVEAVGGAELLQPAHHLVTRQAAALQRLVRKCVQFAVKPQSRLLYEQFRF